MAGSTRSGTSQPDQMASRGAQIVDIKPQPSATQDRFKIKISQDTYVSSDKDYRRPVCYLEPSPSPFLKKLMVFFFCRTGMNLSFLYNDDEPCILT